jgi:hypothetical protein
MKSLLPLAVGIALVTIVVTAKIVMTPAEPKWNSVCLVGCQLERAFKESH